MFEVVFKVNYDNLYLDMSEKYPSFKMFTWCNNSFDIHEIIVEKQEEFKRVIEELDNQNMGGMLEESTDSHKLHLMVDSCHCNIGNSIGRNIGDLLILKIQPTVIEKGWEYHRVIIYRHEDFDKLLSQLTGNGFVVEVLRKVPYDGLISSSLTLTYDTFLSGLTEKQVEALLIAHKHGYYKLPRLADVQSISGKEGVARTTFQEHLKKAENKIIEALVPYLTMFKLSTSEQRRRLLIK